MTNKIAIRLSPNELEIMKIFNSKPYEFVSIMKSFFDENQITESAISALEEKGALFDKMLTVDTCSAHKGSLYSSNHYRFRGWPHD